jgi:hypothetical protein
MDLPPNASPSSVPAIFWQELLSEFRTVGVTLQRLYEKFGTLEQKVDTLTATQAKQADHEQRLVLLERELKEGKEWRRYTLGLIVTMISGLVYFIASHTHWSK